MKNRQHTKAAKFAVQLLEGIEAELQDLVKQPLIEWTLRGHQVLIDVSKGLQDLRRDYPDLFSAGSEFTQSEKDFIETIKKNIGTPKAPESKKFEDPLIRP